jgi:hypothetical protein
MRKLVVALLGLVCAVISMFAQSSLATINGVVIDAQGGNVAGATITANQEATGEHFTVKTNEAGFYSIPNLAVGAYSVSIAKEGFRRSVHPNIMLTTGIVLALGAKLEIGAVTETVSVSAEAPLVESRTSDTGQLIESKNISDLPLSDHRTMNVVALTPASVYVGYNSGQKPNVSLAGGRTQSQMIWIDGGTDANMRMGIGQMDLDPPVDAVQEVRLISTNYSAEYGGSAGGVIVETTKSGTNEFRGSVFEYFRNNATDAPGFFAPIVNGNKVIPELRSNVFGGVLGGPIKHNKTFFFFATQFRPLRTGSVETLTAPTALERVGNFSHSVSAGKPVILYDPASTVTAGTVSTRMPFPNATIPTSRLDPAGLKAASYYPLPNVGTNTASGNMVTALNAKFYEAKVDHSFNDNNRVMVRYIYDNENTNTTSIYPDPAADPTGFLPAHENMFNASYTRVFSATKVNSLRWEFSNRYSHAETHGLGDGYAAKIGIPNLSPDAFPNFNPAGYGQLGSTAQERRQYPILQNEIVDDYSWVHGKHSLKFGFESNHEVNHEVNLPTVSGSFGFSTQSTGLPGNAATGNAMASMLIGDPISFAESQTPVLNRVMWYLGAFAQDDWTVSSRLTLNLGLRWETDTPMSDSHNIFNGFDPNAINPVSGTPGVVKFMGLNGYRTTAYNGDHNNFGPRFGYAWKPFRSERTVFRGGFGIFYAHPFDAGVPNQATLGFGTNISITSPDNGLTFPFTLSQGPGTYTTTPLNDSFGAVPVGKTPTTAVTYFDVGRRTGYSEQFNFSIQHQLSGSMVIEASFIGNEGRKLPNATININQIAPSVLGPGHSTQAWRPFPQFNGVSIITPDFATSNYYGGFVRFQKRFSKGLNFNASYTRSKFLDASTEAGNTLGNNNGPYSNYYDRRADYGPSANDIPNRFVFSAVYELPFGRGKQWVSQGAAALIIGGWSLSTVTTVQSGPPVTVIAATNSCDCFSSGSLRPNVSGNPNLNNPTVAQWFNTGVFSQPAIYTFGNEGVGIIRAAGIFDTDLALQRSFSIKERFKLHLRGEFFNATNHTNFGLPNTTFGSSTFGQVTSAGPARQVETSLHLDF